MTDAPVDLSTDDDKGYNRSQLVCCFSMLMALIKRCHWPTDLEASAAFSSALNVTRDGAAYCRHPATAYMLSLLPSISLIMRTYNLLWTREARAKVHPAFASAYDIHDSERNAALGLRSDVDFSEPFNCKQPLDRVKSFMFNIQDYGLQILGNAGQCLGPEFYRCPGLCEALASSALAGLDQLPDYRLRPIVHILHLVISRGGCLDARIDGKRGIERKKRIVRFVKPFVLHCPCELRGTVVLPLLKALFPFVFQKLNSKWENFRLKYGN
ncbi:hypothetical protein IscW_ISCW021647, partial [Ixodes scapularis]